MTPEWTEQDPFHAGPTAPKGRKPAFTGDPQGPLLSAKRLQAGMQGSLGRLGVTRSCKLPARTLGTAEEGGGHHTNPGDREVQTLNSDPQPHS